MVAAVTVVVVLGVGVVAILHCCSRRPLAGTCGRSRHRVQPDRKKTVVEKSFCSTRLDGVACSSTSSGEWIASATVSATSGRPPWRGDGGPVHVLLPTPNAIELLRCLAYWFFPGNVLYETAAQTNRILQNGPLSSGCSSATETSVHLSITPNEKKKKYHAEWFPLVGAACNRRQPTNLVQVLSQFASG